LFDPSVKKLKEELSNEATKNTELVDEVTRLKIILEKSDENQNRELLKELKIKDDLIGERDKRIADL
jgi:hypothetical protein